jgi:hypothetical protein
MKIINKLYDIIFGKLPGGFLEMLNHLVGIHQYFQVSHAKMFAWVGVVKVGTKIKMIRMV